MVDATSPFLNQPLRSEHQARAAREQAEQERRRRLEQHGTAFCRAVLDGAFERVYQTEGSYRLREIQSGAWLEELPSAGMQIGHGPASPVTTDAEPAVVASLANPSRHEFALVTARQSGYGAALRDIARWISAAAVKLHMHADTLAALNAEITQLSSQVDATASSDANVCGNRTQV